MFPHTAMVAPNYKVVCESETEYDDCWSLGMQQKVQVVTPHGWVYGTKSSLAGMSATLGPPLPGPPTTHLIKPSAVFRTSERFAKLTENIDTRMVKKSTWRSAAKALLRQSGAHVEAAALPEPQSSTPPAGMSGLEGSGASSSAALVGSPGKGSNVEKRVEPPVDPAAAPGMGCDVEKPVAAVPQHIPKPPSAGYSGRLAWAACYQQNDTIGS